MIRTPLTLLFCALGAIVSGQAQAVTLSPSSYDLPNGDGQAHGGTYNYWDAAYTGTGSRTTDGAALSGGLGDLTDGLVTDQNWHVAENAAGTGPYVGWRSDHVTVPAITFHFAAPVNITQVNIHADDSQGAGGVSLPSAVAFSWSGGDITLAVTDPAPASAAPSWLQFTLSGVSAVTAITVTPKYGNAWVFVDEVQFIGAPVPEASTTAMLAAGLAMLGLLARRRRL